ncbi:MAG: HigA family addiction module antitoxin [Pseudomonadota bacterium]|nr:HigA family addiction module antitoxin [Pseudomonadota bacterium]
MPALGIPKAEVARALGISRHTLYQLLDEHTRVTPDMALRLGKLCGAGAEIWLAMQTKRDLWEARRRVDISTIPTLSAA